MFITWNYILAMTDAASVAPYVARTNKSPHVFISVHFSHQIISLLNLMLHNLIPMSRNPSDPHDICFKYLYLFPHPLLPWIYFWWDEISTGIYFRSRSMGKAGGSRFKYWSVYKWISWVKLGFHHIHMRLCNFSFDTLIIFFFVTPIHLSLFGDSIVNVNGDVGILLFVQVITYGVDLEFKLV